MRKGQRKPMPRFRGFYIAALVGVAIFAACLLLSPVLAVELGAIAFFAVYLALAFSQLPHLTPAHLKAHADETDAPVVALFLVTLAVVVVCAGSLFLLINAAGDTDPVRLVLSIASVVLSWFMVHTMAALHYAYEYYEAPEATDDKKRGAVGGLEFPGGDEPDGLAFVYFSYVLGMTAQTADVNITSNVMRRLVTWHSVFSFFFNTVIVAATVSIVVSLGN